MPFSIRDAEPSDVAVLSEVFRKSSLSNSGDRAMLLANPDALEFPPLAVLEGRTRAAVSAGGRIVGFATRATVGRRVEVEDLFVDPDWMRRGIGTLLLLDLLAAARERGGEQVEVTANPHALGFYERIGFVIDGERETRFGPAPRMVLVLA